MVVATNACRGERLRQGSAGQATAAPYGARKPQWRDRAVIAVTSGLPASWLTLRIAILLRRLVLNRLTDDLGFDVQRWGMRMRLHPRRNGCEKGALFTPQLYDAAERQELAAEIAHAPEDRPFVFVDVGANVGLLSLFVASRARANARILAFEPESENVRRLRFNIAANPGIPVEVFPLALGETAGTLILDLNRLDKGGTRARHDDDSELGADCIRVECRPLFDVLAQQDVKRIDALKIDVEGAEAAILLPFFRDAPESLWPRLLIIEDTRGMWPVDLFSKLDTFGYRTATRSKLNVMMRR